MKQLNHINNVRKEIIKYFDPQGIIEGTNESFFSPDNRYRIETIEFHQKKPDVNWDVIKVEICNNKSGEKLFEFFSNHDQFLHGWINKNGIQYLICAEDIYGGQTIIDLNNRNMESFSPGIDGFIWTEFHISPQNDILATHGCMWACPFQIKLYDFRDPMNLPLTEIGSSEIDDDMDFIKWIDNYKLLGKTKTGEEKIIDLKGF